MNSTQLAAATGLVSCGHYQEDERFRAVLKVMLEADELIARRGAGVTVQTAILDAAERLHPLLGGLLAGCADEHRSWLERRLWRDWLEPAAVPEACPAAP